MLLAYRHLPAEALTAGLEAAAAAGSVDPQVVIIEARRVATDTSAAVVRIGALARYDRPAPSLTGYDALLQVGS